MDFAYPVEVASHEIKLYVWVVGGRGIIITNCSDTIMHSQNFQGTWS